MISIDVTTTGAAGAAPMPAFVVRPSLRDGLVAIVPTPAPQHGSGLPAVGSTGLPGARFARGAFGGTSFAGTPIACDPAVRPWEPVLAGTTALEHTDVTGDIARKGGYAQRTDSNTPGAQPPGGPLS
jgi:hypothetical protein